MKKNLTIVPINKGDLIHDLFSNITDENQFKTTVGLTPKNEDCDKMNRRVNNEIIVGPLHTKMSIDECECDDEEERLNFPVEFLNSVTPSGMAPHKLEIKVGSIAMLLRNINMRKGMCNGTRIIIRNIYNNFVDAEIISGNGDLSFISFLFKMFNYLLNLFICTIIS